MTHFYIGQRVEYQHMTDSRIYKGIIDCWRGENRFYAFVLEHGKRWLVRRERLRHPGGCPRQGKAA